MGNNRAIGLDGRMPWHLPAELQHFKRATMGKAIVMGRKTWQSIGRPLPGRQNIVISRNSGFIARGADVAGSLNCSIADAEAFYRDPDLKTDEAKPGYISHRSTRRAIDTLTLPGDRQRDIARALGEFATQPKDWLRPDGATPEETAFLFDYVQDGGQLHVHGMAQIAFDDRNAYVNGNNTPLPAGASSLLAQVCEERTLSKPHLESIEQAEMLVWMLQQGLFEIPENS